MKLSLKVAEDHRAIFVAVLADHKYVTRGRGPLFLGFVGLKVAFHSVDLPRLWDALAIAGIDSRAI